MTALDKAIKIAGGIRPLTVVQVSGMSMHHYLKTLFCQRFTTDIKRISIWM